MILAIILGAGVGLVMGLTGAGGSILAVPLLVWGFGWSVPEAVPVALLAVAVSAAFGTLIGRDIRHVRYRAALLIAAAGLLLSPLGLWASQWLPAPVLSILFALVLAAAAWRLFRQTGHSDIGLIETAPVCQVNDYSGRLIWTRPCFLTVSAAGGLTGFLSGLLGVGGGFVIIPALRAATPISMHSAVATSLLAVALTGAGTFAIALAQGRGVDWLAALPFLAGALLGMLIGRALAPRLPGARLQQGFALLAGIVAAGMAVRAFTEL